MSFSSKSQWRAAFGGYLGPEMKSKAKEWAHDTPSFKNLPFRSKKDILKKVIGKHKGKGGPILTPFSQASSPIDLLKTSGTPPTVRPIPRSTSNSLGKR